MKGLIMLFLGTVLLASFSRAGYPVSQLHARSGRHYMRDRTDLFLIIAIVWMSAFSFLRTSYNDTGNYIHIFRTTPPLNEYVQQEGFFSFGGNPFHDVYKALIHDLTDNYHVYFMFPAFVSNIAAVKLFKRYSCNLPFSFVVFFGIGTYVMFIAALKQSIAAAILMAAIPYAIDKKYIQFYVLVAVATMFHTHAVMFLFLPMLFGKPWGRLTWLALAIVLATMATYNITMGTFMNIALAMGVNVADIEVFDGHSINVIRVLVYWVPAVMALCFRNRLFANATRTENLFVNMSIIAAFILSIGLVQGANLYARMAAYFEFATAISLPWMIDKVFTKKSARMINAMGAVLFFGYFYYEFAVSKGFNNGYRAITLWQFIQSLFA